MTKPNIVRFGDGHFRRTIYGLGPYIADYPEQVLLGCIVQGWCTRYVIMYIQLWPCFHQSSRCDAPWNNLDHFHDPGRRAHVLTEALHRADLGKALKEDYGIIPDIMVSTDEVTWNVQKAHTLYSSHLHTISLVRTFMSCYHRIYCIKLSRGHSRIT